MHSEAEAAGRLVANNGAPNAPLRVGERRRRKTRSRHTYRICLPSTARDDVTTTRLCGILRNRLSIFLVRVQYYLASHLNCSTIKEYRAFSTLLCGLDFLSILPMISLTPFTSKETSISCDRKMNNTKRKFGRLK